MIRAGILVSVLSILTAGFLQPLHAEDTVRQRRQKESVQKQLQLRLADVNEKLSSLGGKASSVKEDSRREYESLLKEIRTAQELAARKMAEFGGAGGADWDRLKAESLAAIDELNRKYDRLSLLLRPL